MIYDILFLGSDDTEWEVFKHNYPNAHRMPSDSTFEQLKSKSFTKMFWVVWDNIEFNHEFDLNSYSADKFDDMFVHIFKNGNTYDGVCLFPKNLQPSDVEYKHRFFINRKEVDIVASKPRRRFDTFEVVFISYQEPNAEKHYRELKKIVPDAHRVHGVKGIHQAHIEAAKQVKSDMFYVVDGDAEIVDSFNFDHNTELFERDTVYVWKSKNPINDLTYGYGGVKLLPRERTLDMDVSKTDMTTSISGKFKLVDQVSNITAFNTDPYNTWKSAFRECAKLASRSIDRQNDSETEERLKIWSTVGETAQFGNYAIQGAKEGYRFGIMHRYKKDGFEAINDFDWLKEQFEKNNDR